MDSKKSYKIREIVRLRQILKKWRKLANSSKPAAATFSSNGSGSSSGSKSMKFLKRTLSLSENAAREVVPKGCLAVSVGEEQKRFVIPMEHLGHPAFEILLREAEEEFGFQQTGVLRIPCEVGMFESVLKMVEGRKKKEATTPYFVAECRFSMEDFVGYCSPVDSPLNQPSHLQSPMCR